MDNSKAEPILKGGEVVKKNAGATDVDGLAGTCRGRVTRGRRAPSNVGCDGITICPASFICRERELDCSGSQHLLPSSLGSSLMKQHTELVFHAENICVQALAY